MTTVDISRQEPGITVLTLNRPDRLNTINAESDVRIVRDR